MHSGRRGTRRTVAQCAPAVAACRQRSQAQPPHSQARPPCSSRRGSARSEEPSCIVRTRRNRQRCFVIADTCCSRLHALIMSIRVLIMSIRVLIMSIRVMLLTAVRSNARCAHLPSKKMSRWSKALLALHERAGKGTQARPAGGAAWVNIGTVGSRPRARFAPAQRTVPPLVGAPGLARRRLCCDKSRTINVRICYDRSRHSRTSASHVHLPAATLTGWLGSAHSRGQNRFLPAKAESQSAFLHARESYSGYSGYSGYSHVHRHRRMRTRGCEEVLGSLGLRASKAQTNKTARFLCALETTRSNQDSSVLHSTRADPHSPTRSVLAVTSGIPNTPHLALLWARFERRGRWPTARWAGSTAVRTCADRPRPMQLRLDAAWQSCVPAADACGLWRHVARATKRRESAQGKHTQQRCNVAASAGEGCIKARQHVRAACATSHGKEAACKEERRIQAQPRVRAQRPCTSRASPRTPPHSDPANGHTRGTVRANREREAEGGAASKGGGGVHASGLVRRASAEAGTGAVVVVDAAAAAAAPSPLALGAVLLAAAWAAAPVVMCASSSLQAVSCLGASVLSFQLRWPAAAPAKPNRHRHWKRPSSRRTKRVRACEGQRR